MKHFFLLLITCCVFALPAQLIAQTENTNHSYSHNDSVYLAKMNSNANLMIAGGVGLCAAGGYLMYQGITVYRTHDNSNTAAAQTQNEQNRKQGIIYLSAAGVGTVGGIVLVALGARNKIDFKRRKNQMSATLGMLNDGQLGLALEF